MRRLRLGEWLAGAAAVGLLVVLCLDWFAPDGGSGEAGWAAYAPLGSVLHRSGWASLGWLLAGLLALLAFGGLSITYMTLRRTSPAWPVGAAVLTIAVGIVVLLVLVVRLLAQPSLGADLPNAAVAVRAPAYLGLLCAALIPLGAWIALRDERLHAAESAVTPPPARPVPGT